MRQAFPEIFYNVRLICCQCGRETIAYVFGETAEQALGALPILEFNGWIINDNKEICYLCHLKNKRPDLYRQLMTDT